LPLSTVSKLVHSPTYLQFSAIT